METIAKQYGATDLVSVSQCPEPEDRIAGLEAHQIHHTGDQPVRISQPESVVIGHRTGKACVHRPAHLGNLLHFALFIMGLYCICTNILRRGEFWDLSFSEERYGQIIHARQATDTGSKRGAPDAAL